MVGNTIDLTDPRTLEAFRNAIAVAPEDTSVWPKLEKEKRVQKAEADICTRHRMRKSIRGKSWRCVR